MSSSPDLRHDAMSAIGRWRDRAVPILDRVAKRSRNLAASVGDRAAGRSRRINSLVSERRRSTGPEGDAAAPATSDVSDTPPEADTGGDEQEVGQPAPIAGVLEGRESGQLESLTKAELYSEARARDITGRSSMTKAELIVALRAAASSGEPGQGSGGSS